MPLGCISKHVPSKGKFPAWQRFPRRTWPPLQLAQWSFCCGRQGSEIPCSQAHAPRGQSGVQALNCWFWGFGDSAKLRPASGPMPVLTSEALSENLSISAGAPCAGAVPRRSRRGVSVRSCSCRPARKQSKLCMHISLSIGHAPCSGDHACSSRRCRWRSGG